MYNLNYFINYLFKQFIFFLIYKKLKLKNEKSSVNLDNITNQIQNKDLLGSYLAGL